MAPFGVGAVLGAVLSAERSAPDLSPHILAKSAGDACPETIREVDFIS